MAENETPAASRRGFLRSGGMSVLAGAMGAATAAATAGPATVGISLRSAAISPELERLIEAHRRASDEFRNLGDAEYEDMEAAFSAADDAAFDALSTYRCQTIDEVRLWAPLILAYVEHYDWFDRARPALRALAGLPAEDGEA